ncbi:MAG: cation diffusion facilitator family transporter [Alphaproteobacteria bacterium]|jgi:ferrous-iron efflux pump FieF|nr:cation diffusion facilitator family transporter [Alphaproteobacteria bacterium]MDP7222313.1 cation diffusion facilitator family transporter [Alphaproteobacteria bacterium]
MHNTSQSHVKDYKPHFAVIASCASVATVTILIVIKAFAFAASGSTSVLASMIDSIADAAISIMSFLAVRYSMKPADHDHRHGHGKIEGLVAIFQGAFIGGAGVALLIESFLRFQTPKDVEHHTMAIGVMAVSIVLSLLLVLIQKLSLSKAPSLAVEADKAHYGMDIAVNLGVIATLTALSYGAPSWVDPAFAVCVVLYMVTSIRSIVKGGIDMLLDREVSGEIREQIIHHVLSHDGVLGMHDLRTKKSGMRIFISFDIEVDAELSLSAAHDITKDLEKELFHHFPNAETMIHVDPHGDTADIRHQVAGVHH